MIEMRWVKVPFDEITGNASRLVDKSGKREFYAVLQYREGNWSAASYTPVDSNIEWSEWEDVKIED